MVGRSARLDLYSGVADIVARDMRSVGAGEFIKVPLSVERGDDGSANVISTNQTSGDNGRTTTWRLGVPGKYRLVASLSTAEGVERPDLPAPCALPQAEATVEFEMTS